MKKSGELAREAYEFEGKLPLKQAIPLGLQHVLAMFVGNLTPLLIITGVCGIGSASEYADIQVALLQNAMIIAGVVTLIQLFAIGPVGGKVPIIMGTSSGFRFHGKYRAGNVGTDRDPGDEALGKRNFQFFFYFSGNYCGVYRSSRYGNGSSTYRSKCRGC